MRDDGVMTWERQGELDLRGSAKLAAGNDS